MPIDLDELSRFAATARDALRRQAVDILQHRVGVGAQVVACPRCGDRIILLDAPLTYALDGGVKVCKACRAERDLAAIALPEADLGGEGG